MNLLQLISKNIWGKVVTRFGVRAVVCQRINFTNSSSLYCHSSKTEIQLLAEYKRQQKQLKKETKRLERIDRQQQNANKSIKAKILYDVPTQPGDKKDVLTKFPESYSPQYVEAAWYDWWQKEGFFSPDYFSKKYSCEDPGQFVMCLPPPNVTGSLHLGHALGNSIQDAICRWHRMNGRAVLWNPGCDHAGIATQIVVEKKIWKEQRETRHNLGRAKFVEEVWKWKNEKGDRIYDQMKRLGSSLDWSRACFTLDPKLCRAVNEAFIRLHEDGIIYRSKRLVNWSCTLRSAISDIEVENLQINGKTKLDIPGYDHQIPFGVISTFSYPIDGSEEMLSVSTTRLETMLGDTAVAVHPSDHRFSHLRGKYIWHPFCNRKLRIIFDEAVDPEFGTGAVKVTPGHDHKDYEMGLRHGLEMLNIFDDAGNLVGVPDEFLGMKRFHAREKVRSSLQSLGLYRGTEDHAMVIPVCSRSKDVVEFLLKDQWFVNCKKMSEDAIEAVDSGRLVLIPGHYAKQWKDWLLSTKDWCISRQLWWGHRIPAYNVSASVSDKNADTSEHWMTAHSEAEARKKGSALLGIPEGDLTVCQDDDVLDTWFSSAVFPFSIFGWPDQTEDFLRFYPTTLLETASDIMFFWVARMVMLGEKLTGKLPFKQVLFHSILHDAHGRKMSKSLGNVIDPMDVIHGVSLNKLLEDLEKSNLDPAEIIKAKSALQRDFPLGIPECGADALRFSLCSYNYLGHFINVDINHIETSRRFCNKIWQSFRFVIGKLDPDFRPTDVKGFIGSMSATDIWIMSRLSDVTEISDQGFRTYNLQNVTRALQHFWWSEFCDVYLEYAKPVLQTGSPQQQNIIKNIMVTCFDVGLRLLSPFMPFLTEELHQRLPKTNDNNSESIMVATFPQPHQVDFRNIQIEDDMKVVSNITARIMSLCNDVNFGKSKPNLYIFSSLTNTKRAVLDHRIALQTLSRAASLTVLNENDVPPTGCIQIEEQSDWKVFIQLEGLVDAQQAIDRLCHQKEKVEGELQTRKLDERSLIVQEKINSLNSILSRLDSTITALRTLK